MRSHLHFSAKRVLAAACVAAMTGFLGCSAADPGPAGSGSSSTGSGTPATGGSSGGNGASSGTPGSGTGGGTTSPGTGGTTPGGTGTPAGGASGTVSADETWASGKQITGALVIAPGVTVTIDPGAAITVADGATITVGGALKGKSTAAAHAKLSGAAWTGIVVEQGGTLGLDGVDLVNAVTALDVKGGNTAATFSNGVITAPTAPFSIAIGGKLAIDHSSVTGTKGMSSVGGAFTASYLDYDSNGNEGIAAIDASAVLTIDDSKFHGTSNNGGDMIVANNAASVHISHSEISKCHCAFHFNAITSFDVSFMNVHDDSYGFMMYGSSTAGKRTVADSNFTTLAGAGIDEAGTNGAIAVTNCYFNAVAGGNNVKLVDAQITVTSPAKAAVPGAGPRP